MEPECSLPCSQQPVSFTSLRQINRVQVLPFYFFNLRVYFNMIFIFKVKSYAWIFPSGFPAKIFLSHTMRATRPAHLIFLPLRTI